MAKKRIAMAVNTLSRGGAERTVSNQSLILSAWYDIDIIVNDTHHLEYPYRGQIISLGMPRDRNRMGAGYQILALIRRTALLRKLRKERQYAAVLSFSEMTNLANVLSRRAGGKTIISCRNAPKKQLREGWKYLLALKCLLPFCVRRADRTVSCSKEIADELCSYCGLPASRSAVIYNGVNSEKIRALAQEPIPDGAGVSACAEGRKLLVSAGRLTAQKGQAHLIRAVKKLREDGLDVKLLLLGEGELRPALEKLARGLGLNGDVLLPGFSENPFPFLTRADAFVSASLYEGFSNVLVEALACGVPCVSTDHVSGAREILAPETDYRRKTTAETEKAAFGILVPVCEKEPEGAEAWTEEEARLADAIREVLTDAELSAHYRAAALKRADELDLASVSRQWRALIEETAGT